MSADYVLKSESNARKSIARFRCEKPNSLWIWEDRASQFTQYISKKAENGLHCKSSGLSLKKKETVDSRYSSLITPVCVQPRGEIIAASEEIPSLNKFSKLRVCDELSLENFSRDRKSTKLRNAGSKSLNRAPSVAGNTNESFNEKKRSKLSSPPPQSLIDTVNENLQLFHSESQKSKEFKLDYEESASSVEVFEKPANNGQGDENSDYDSFPQISASDSEMSDWRDEFSFPESESEFNAAESISESTDSCSYSSGTWRSRSTSRTLKPMCELTLKPKDPLPAGMLFVGWLNTKSGNRFKTFQLDDNLQTVIDWLGTPLPIVIQEPGRGRRRCDSELTLAQVMGKMPKSPSQQGIAFFIGPVNSKLSYLMTMVDLSQLCALKAGEDKELEKLKSWV